MKKIGFLIIGILLVLGLVLPGLSWFRTIDGLAYIVAPRMFQL